MSLIAPAQSTELDAALKQAEKLAMAELEKSFSDEPSDGELEKLKSAMSHFFLQLIAAIAITSYKAQVRKVLLGDLADAVTRGGIQ